jgi:hypothetical protein
MHHNPSSIVLKVNPDLYAAKQTSTLCFGRVVYQHASKTLIQRELFENECKIMI